MKFSVENLINYLTERYSRDDDTDTDEEVMWNHLEYERIEGYHNLKFIINGENILCKEDEACMLCIYLRSINNIFFALLKTYCNEPIPIPINIYFEDIRIPTPFILASKNNDKIVFLPTKDFPDVDKTPIDITQAYEEVIRVVNEYKDIFWQAAKILMPNNLIGFMGTVFLKEERYLKNTNLNEYQYAEEWLPLETFWNEYKKRL